MKYKLHVFTSDISPMGLYPGFATVCEQKWAKSGINREWSQYVVRMCQVLCLLIKQMRVNSPSTKHDAGTEGRTRAGEHPWVMAGGRQNPARGWRQTTALVRLRGKKLYTVEEIIFHLPAGQLVLGRVFSV